MFRSTGRTRSTRFDDRTTVIREEVDELMDASSADEATHEAADVLFFALTRAIQLGSSLGDIERELDRRSRIVSRRRGDAKPAYTGAKS